MLRKWIVSITIILLLSACSEHFFEKTPDEERVTHLNKQTPPPVKKEVNKKTEQEKDNTTHSNDEEDKSTHEDNEQSVDDSDSIAVVTNEDSIVVLVNKQNMLPTGYTPDDLVYPNVRFTFDEKVEKRMMRKEAAHALEKLFAAADRDGLPLAGVSAYRSNERQKQLFDYYVSRDGLEKTQTYSAYPGTSEHETGLAIDVVGANGKCIVTDCFGDQPEATWLAENAHKFGFIIRYPKGKEHITGYKYEPWHLRYVGNHIATEIQKREITLEEYFEIIQVNN